MPNPSPQTLAEMREHPLLRILASVWETCGVTDDDLPKPFPEIDIHKFGDQQRDQQWFAENFPKVSAKLEAAAREAEIPYRTEDGGDHA